MTSPISSRMIGRDADLARLRSMLAEASRAVPRTAVIGGEAGIGKSRLLAEFTAAIGPEAILVTGQCVDLGAVAAPYAPVKGVLRELVGRVGAPAVLAAAGPGRSALPALLPELAPPDEAASAAAVISADQVHEAVAVVLETLARDEPLVVVVEDLHWIDSASLSLLRFLVRSLGSARLLLVLSYRTDDVIRGHPVRGFLSELERGRLIERWELARLTRDEVGSQVRSIAGAALSASVLESMFERSDGVPFFVEELVGLDGCRDDGTLPDTLRELLLGRYERLTPPAQALLRLLAAGGVAVPHVLLERVFDGSADELDAAAREAIFASVLVADSDEYAFRHALVREAVHAELLPGERTRFHTRYAEALESSSAPRWAEISYHWMSANAPATAFPATLEAMRQARAAFAFGTAAQMGERALELWDHVPGAETIAGMPKVDLIGRTASHLRNAGEGERSLAFIELALAETPPGDDLRQARSLRDKAFYLMNQGKTGAIDLLERALALVPSGSPGDLRATIVTALAGRFMIEARLDEAIDTAAEAVAEAQAAGADRFTSIAWNISGVCLVHRGDIELGLEHLEHARVVAGTDGSANLRYRVNASDLAYLLGRYQEAVDLAEEGLARARALGVERSSGVILASNAVDPYFALGEWSRAERLIERGLAPDPPFAFRVYLQRARLWGMLWSGDVEGATAQYRGIRASIASLVAVEMQTRLGMARLAGEIALAGGDADEAWHEAAVLFREEHRTIPGYDLPLLALAARSLAVLRSRGTADDVTGGDAAAAAAIRQQLSALAFWPTAASWGAIVEAELSGPAGTGTDPAAWRAAIAVLAVPEAQAHLPLYAAARLGEALVAQGERAEARTVLADAARRADAAGIGLVAAEARRIAERAGVPDTADPAVDDPSASGELTARERQVLDLIAEGLSNRQIGERLFISGKTVSVHVSAILRKLGASSRTEAVFRARVAHG